MFKFSLKAIAIAAVIILLGSINADADVVEGFKLGVKGGLTFGEMHFDEERDFFPNAGKDERVGWNVGVTMQYTGSSGFGLDLSILYARNEYGYRSRYENTIRKDMIDLPMHVTFHIPTSVNRIFSPYLYTGPDLMFGLEDTRYIFNDYLYTRYYDYRPASVVFSWNVGIGVMLFSHVQLQGGYTFGISNTLEDNHNTSYGKGRVWNVSAAVIF